MISDENQSEVTDLTRNFPNNPVKDETCVLEVIKLTAMTNKMLRETSNWTEHLKSFIDEFVECSIQGTAETEPLRKVDEYQPKASRKVIGDSQIISNKHETSELEVEKLKKLVKNVIQEDSKLNEHSKCSKRSSNAKSLACIQEEPGPAGQGLLSGCASDDDNVISGEEGFMKLWNSHLVKHG